MNKTKPFEVISTRFQISRESAKYFLIRVQKSFKTEKPPHHLILQFMQEKDFESLPRPHQVASLMYEAGLWSHPLNPEPPSPVPWDEGDLYDE